MIMDNRVGHVSDTALLVAAARAMESERPDGLIHDPFAARLAGDRGMALLHNVQVSGWLELGLGLRTDALDELLRVALANGADTVLSLGAGLDARAWRLNLPEELRWIEVDFPEMLDYKYAVLEGIAPRCRLERRTADLNCAPERRKIITEAASGALHPLMMTEGLLMYLPAETVHALAEESRAAGFEFWLMDTSSPGLMRLAHGDAVEHINRVRAESHLEGPQIRQAVQQYGWNVFERRLFIEEVPKLALERVREIVSKTQPPDPTGHEESGMWLYRAEG